MPPIPKTTKKKEKPKNKMPKRSPRNHNSTKSADTKIAARVTTLNIYEVQHRSKEIENEKEGEVAPKVNIDSPTAINNSSGFHLLAQPYQTL